MSLSRQERAWMVSQLIRQLLPIYGTFPLPETIARHKQLVLRFKGSTLRKRHRWNGHRKKEVCHEQEA